MPTDQGPWELKRYDPDYDERRGGFDTYGFYRNRETAQAIADAHNAEIVAAINARAQAEYDKQMKRWRTFQRDDMPTKPILLASLSDIPEPKYANARWGGKYSYEFMEVQAMEFEDD